MKSGQLPKMRTLLFLLASLSVLKVITAADHPPVENCKVQNPETGICSECNEGFYFINHENSCKTCEKAIVGCKTCQKGAENQAECTECAATFFLLSKSCSECSLAIVSCEECTSASTCTKCTSGRYLSADSKSCLSCKDLDPQCVACSDEKTCTKCGFAELVPQGPNCVQCSSKIADCKSCTPVEAGQFTCNSCADSKIVDDNKCVECNSVLPNCLNCASKTECLACKDSFFIDESKKCAECQSSIPNCNRCTDKKTCTQCTSTYFPQLTSENASECKLCSEKTTNCQECDKDGHCFKCDSAHVLSPKGLCLGCFEAYPGCTECDSAHCKTCQLGLFLTEQGSCESCGANCVKCSNGQGCLECASFHGGVGATCLSFWWPIAIFGFLVAFGFGLYFYNARKVSYEDLYTNFAENDGDILNGSKSLQDPLNAGGKSTKQRRFVDEEED